MKRPPNRKLLLAAIVLLAAGAAASRPAIGFSQQGQGVMLILNKLLGQERS